MTSSITLKTNNQITLSPIARAPADITSKILNYIPNQETAYNVHLVSTFFKGHWGNDGHLDLSDSNITDADLLRIIQEHQNKSKKIISLNLAGCQNITDVGLKHLSTLRSLTQLNLYNCYQITDVGLQHLSTLHSLMLLDLGWCGRITDVGLQHLSTLVSLTQLDLVGCFRITESQRKSPSILIANHLKNSQPLHLPASLHTLISEYI
jgi:Leucine Rich repeat